MRRRFMNVVVDPLTGLLTRDELTTRFNMLSREQRAGFSLIDIDHFKLINDCNGHQRGDEVLAAFGRFLKQEMEHGSVFRMGGDEFLVMLEGYGKRASKRFAQRLKRNLSREVFKGEPDLHITMSAGVAVFPDDGRTLRDILRCADERMYSAKRNGRDQYCCEDVPGEGKPFLHEPTRLIGREKEFLLMKEQFDGAIHGHMSAMVVTGERGVGKTFFSHTFLKYAEMRASLVRRIELREVFDERSMVKCIIEGVCPEKRTLKALFQDKRVEYGAELALFVGEGMTKRAIEEYRIQKAIRDLLALYARSAGSLVVFIDNGERGGDHALRLLDSLADKGSDAPLFLLIGWGCDAVGQCKKVCERYRTSTAVMTTLLRPLSRHDQKTIMKILLGNTKLGNTLCEFVYERAEGNPLLVKEVLQAALEQSIISRNGEHECAIANRGGKIALSNSIRELLEGRLHGLGKEEKELLQHASVIGKCFESSTLGQLREIDEESVASMLRVPIECGILRDKGKGHFCFRLMYRDSCYGSIPKTERAFLHGKVARLLLRSGAISVRRRSYHHFVCAGEDARARKVAVSLFTSAMEKGRFTEARQYIEAINQGKKVDSNDKRLLSALAKCYVMNGMHEEAIALYRTLMVASPGEKNRAALMIARLYRKMGKHSEALDVLLAIRTKSRPLLCTVLHEIAETLLGMGRLEKAEGYAKRALLLAKQGQQKKQEADGYYTTAGIFWYRGEYELAGEFLGKALSLYKRTGGGKEQGLAMNRLGIVKWSEGNLEDAIDLIEKAVVVFKQKAGIEEEHRAYANLGILHEAMGRWKDAHRYYRKSLDMAQFLHVVPLACRNHNNIGTLLLKEGRFEDAMLHLKKALSLRKRSGEEVDLASSYHNLGIAYLYRGMYGRAAHFLAKARKVFEREGAAGMLISNLNACLELCTFQKKFSKAKRLKEQLLRLIDANGTGLQQAQFFRVLARFHRLRGELDASRQYARGAVELLNASYEPYEKGKALYELGRVLLEDGSRSEATKVLRRARATFKQLGAKKALERVEQSMVKRGVGIYERRKQGRRGNGR